MVWSPASMQMMFTALFFCSLFGRRQTLNCDMMHCSTCAYCWESCHGAWRVRCTYIYIFFERHRPREYLDCDVGRKLLDFRGGGDSGGHGEFLLEFCIAFDGTYDVRSSCCIQGRIRRFPRTRWRDWQDSWLHSCSSSFLSNNESWTLKTSCCFNCLTNLDSHDNCIVCRTPSPQTQQKSIGIRCFNYVCCAKAAATLPTGAAACQQQQHCS